MLRTSQTHLVLLKQVYEKLSSKLVHWTGVLLCACACACATWLCMRGLYGSDLCSQVLVKTAMLLVMFLVHSFEIFWQMISWSSLQQYWKLLQIIHTIIKAADVNFEVIVQILTHIVVFAGPCECNTSAKFGQLIPSLPWERELHRECIAPEWMKYCRYRPENNPIFRGHTKLKNSFWRMHNNTRWFCFHFQCSFHPPGFQNGGTIFCRSAATVLPCTVGWIWDQTSRKWFCTFGNQGTGKSVESTETTTSVGCCASKQFKLKIVLFSSLYLLHSF